MASYPDVVDAVDREQSPRVLVAEDDASLAAMLADLLTSEGYVVDVVADGQRALHLGLTREYDVMVLDRGLPAVEGLDLIGRLRAKAVATPVLVLSALALPRDRVDGLDAGAEDYLGKPFDVEELLARLRALLRRRADSAALESVPVPGGWLEVQQRCVTRPGGTAVDLSARESALLEVLARRPRRVFGRAELLSAAFAGVDDPGVVDTYVHYVRRKLGRGVVETVHGLGYRLGRG